MEFKFDFHVHSNYSHDSKMSLKSIVKKYKKKGFDGIAITDHDTFNGAILAERLSEEYGIKIIKGEEVSTELGDIIGLFLKKEIKSKVFSEAVTEIKGQGGIVILPHPAMYHVITADVLKEIDAIEVFNSKIGEGANKMAFELAKKYKKPMVAGSDAHIPLQIGLCKTVINSKDKTDKALKKAILSGRIKIEKENISFLRKVRIKLAIYWGRYVS